MKAAVHTVGGRDDDETRAGASGETRPYLDDLPLDFLDTQADTSETTRATARRSWWRVWWRPALPAFVALVLVLAVVVVVPVFEDPATRAGDTEGDAESPGNRIPPTMASIGDNPLHGTGVRPGEIACDLPELVSGRDRLRAFYEAQLRCLERAWRPALRTAGLSFRSARVSIADGPDTACGALPPRAEATGLYCAEDTTIYLPRARTLAAFGLKNEAHIATLAHEYGHHVQQLSGILGSASGMLSHFPRNGPRENELGRRVELQANCLAGMFLRGSAGRGSIDRELAVAAVDDFQNWIDSDTHGSPRTQREWARRGYDADGAVACDTWHAPLKQVE